MTTEHFALQTARSATIVDSSGRSNLFELAPEMHRYFIHPIHDDTHGALLALGVTSLKRQHLLTNAWAIAAITGVLIAVCAGLVADRLRAPMGGIE